MITNQVDAIRREAMGQFNGGNHAKGLQALVGMAGGLILAGAAQDEVIDFLYTRHSHVEKAA